MTHGNEGVLYAKDHQYPVDLLWNKLSGFTRAINIYNSDIFKID